MPLDVRGSKINVNRSFLTRYPNSYLAEVRLHLDTWRVWYLTPAPQMFSANSRYTPARLADGSYSIDADPGCFMAIINFLQVDRGIFMVNLSLFVSFSPDCLQPAPSMTACCSPPPAAPP